MDGLVKSSATPSIRGLLQQVHKVSWTCWQQQHPDLSPQQGGRHPVQLLQHLPHHHLFLTILVNVELSVMKPRRDGKRSSEEMEGSSVRLANHVTQNQSPGKSPSPQEEEVVPGVEEQSSIVSLYFRQRIVLKRGEIFRRC